MPYVYENKAHITEALSDLQLASGVQDSLYSVDKLMEAKRRCPLHHDEAIDVHDETINFLKVIRYILKQTNTGLLQLNLSQPYEGSIGEGLDPGEEELVARLPNVPLPPGDDLEEYAARGARDRVKYRYCHHVKELAKVYLQEWHWLHYYDWTEDDCGLEYRRRRPLYLSSGDALFQGLVDLQHGWRQLANLGQMEPFATNVTDVVET